MRRLLHHQAQGISWPLWVNSGCSMQGTNLIKNNDQKKQQTQNSNLVKPFTKKKYIESPLVFLQKLTFCL